MIGVAELTDAVVGAAVEGARAARAEVFGVLGPRVRLMVAARLSPTPEQFAAVDDIAQEVMAALARELPHLVHRTVGGLNAFVSGIVTRQVALSIRRQGFARDAGGHPVSLDSTIAGISSGGPLWQFLSAGGTSPRTAAERAEQARLLMTALGRVKPEHRAVITLAFFDVVVADGRYADPRVFNYLYPRGKDVLAVLKDNHPVRRGGLEDARSLFATTAPVGGRHGTRTCQHWDLAGFTTWPQVAAPIRVVRSLESWSVRRQLDGQGEEQHAEWLWVTTLALTRTPTGAVVQLGHARWARDPVPRPARPTNHAACRPAGLIPNAPPHGAPAAYTPVALPNALAKLPDPRSDRKPLTRLTLAPDLRNRCRPPDRLVAARRDLLQ